MRNLSAIRCVCRFFLGWLLCLMAQKTFAQNAIYLANGNQMVGAEILDITDERLKYAIRRGDAMINYAYARENVLIAFKEDGNFLIISELSPELATAKKQLKGFLATPIRRSETDLLIVAVPLSVIPAMISYESDEVINYRLPDSSAASINKTELIGILYRTGKHALFRDPVEVAPLLPSVRAMLNKPSAPAPTEVVAVSAPTKPTPVSAGVAVLPASENNSSLPSVAPTGQSKVKLSEEEYQLYREKALRRVDEFSSYLNVITDKTLPTDEKDKAIEQAARLFMPSATIEVTSANRPGSRRYPIREYLARLKLLPYGSASIEWNEVQYVKELKQEADGNYYGMISGQQTFTGYGADGKKVMYSDVTQKNVKVKLQSYQKIIDGQEQLNWDVLLGNIGVATN
jgi:hypothetical protein